MPILTKRIPRSKNGLCYLACTVAVGTILVTFDLRLYLRAATVRRINRRRSAARRIPSGSRASQVWGHVK